MLGEVRDGEVHEIRKAQRFRNDVINIVRSCTKTRCAIGCETAEIHAFT